MDYVIYYFDDPIGSCTVKGNYVEGLVIRDWSFTSFPKFMDFDLHRMREFLEFRRIPEVRRAKQLGSADITLEEEFKVTCGCDLSDGIWLQSEELRDRGINTREEVRRYLTTGRRGGSFG